MTDSTVVVPRRAVAALLDPHATTRMLRDAHAALRDAVRQEVPWHHARAMLADLRSEVDRRDPHVVANVDQVAAYATERLAESGVDVRDPRVLFEVLAVLSLVSECAMNGYRSGALTVDEAGLVRGMCRVLGVTFGAMAPPEARAR